MSNSFLFYISGHGFGHARRMTQVIRELLRINPRASVQIRTAAPARIFDGLPGVRVEHCEIDAGLVEQDALTIDREKSLRRIADFLARREAIIATEVAAVHRLNPDIIVADIPFLAGDVAAEAGVPGVAISNFTWDWIYESLFAGDARYAEFADSIRKSHAKFSMLLELPFGRTSPAIGRKIQMPLIAMRSNREPDDILSQIGVTPGDQRPRVLIGTRGGLAPGVLSRLAADTPEFLFLHPYPSTEPLPDNAMTLQLGPSLDFSDLMRIGDVVVSKLGYGLISECIATQTRLLWPPRDGFAEDEIVAREAPKFVPMLRMGIEDYRAGRWGKTLREAMSLPIAAQVMSTDGARVCAEFIARERAAVAKLKTRPFTAKASQMSTPGQSGAG